LLILWSVYVMQLLAILEALYLRYPGSLVFDAASWVALAVMVSGLALRTCAVMTLGADFAWHVNVRQGQRVIDSGPYRWVRHPGYAGAWLTYVGTTVFLGTWWACAVTVPVLTVAFVRKIRLEEATLERELGEAYAAYEKRTARMVPGLW
jgi:protein-S-isoprenylcysteine O-methyltransferase Ste14